MPAGQHPAGTPRRWLPGHARGQRTLRCPCWQGIRHAHPRVDASREKCIRRRGKRISRRATLEPHVIKGLERAPWDVVSKGRWGEVETKRSYRARGACLQVLSLLSEAGAPTRSRGSCKSPAGPPASVLARAQHARFPGSGRGLPGWSHGHCRVQVRTACRSIEGHTLQRTPCALRRLARALRLAAGMWWAGGR